MALRLAPGLCPTSSVVGAAVAITIVDTLLARTAGSVSAREAAKWELRL
jgi:hypothetical protein